MAFAQPLGPQATSRQLRDLAELLGAQGFADFKAARRSMGFTQRQGSGKFTAAEADAYIEQLQNSDAEDLVAQPSPVAQRLSSTERTLRQIPDERLAAELQRRGWIVMEP